MSAQTQQEETQQEESLCQKIKAVEAEIKEANDRRKEFDRQLRWLKKATPEIDAEIVRRIEAKDGDSRQWVAHLRQQAIDAIYSTASSGQPWWRPTSSASCSAYSLNDSHWPQ